MTDAFPTREMLKERHFVSHTHTGERDHDTSSHTHTGERDHDTEGLKSKPMENFSSDKKITDDNQSTH